ncbi:hypothetical protein EDD22DRAFT_876352 [Suillus occidentalis]|nr:hypothetical protein EDD22DRAFT_876352 [Suillus occidentalis]
MISRTRRALLSLVFAPWISAAPTMQRSELLLVESSCNFDLSTIQHELCAIVHDVAKTLEDEAAVNTSYIIDLSEYSQKGVISTASAAHLQTIFDTSIAARSPNHDSGAGRPIVIEHNTKSLNSLNFPEIRFSTNGGPVLINFVLLSDRQIDKLDSVWCTRRLTWDSLDVCDQEPLESWKITLSDDGRPERHNLMEELFRGKMQWKRNGASESNNLPREEGGHNVDIRGDEEIVNEDDDEKLDDGHPEENPTDEQQEFLPPVNSNSWSITFILLMISSVLIIATRLFYARLRGLLRSYQKPNRFRVGETMLLRWAHEDMNFDDEEEDTMVNGGDGLITGEEIPLKPSPRKNFVIRYGSAQ